MTGSRQMRISFAASLVWVVLAGVLVGLLGAFPTWHLAGRDGLAAELWAGGIVLVAVVLSAAVVVCAAWRGPATAAAAFPASGLIRLGVGLALGCAAARWAGVDAAAFFVWPAVFYLAMLGAESFWLARALNRDADDVARGRLRCPGREPPDARREGVKRPSC